MGLALAGRRFATDGGRFPVGPPPQPKMAAESPPMPRDRDQGGRKHGNHEKGPRTRERPRPNTTLSGGAIVRDEYIPPKRGRPSTYMAEKMAERKAALVRVEVSIPVLPDPLPDWMLPASPYRYEARTRPKQFKGTGKRFDPWSGKRQPDTTKALKQWLFDYKKTNGCCCCGETEPECLHFHHRDPQYKAGDVGSLIGRGRTVVLFEIAKCDLLCANCHAKVHAGILVRENALD